MDHIINALERAKANPTPQPPHGDSPSPPLGRSIKDFPRADAHQAPPGTIELDSHHLESMKIIGHDAADLRTRSVDMLRTQLLQVMETSGWHVLAVTSPNPGCGKTFTAINLALSIARQPEVSVLLVDMDLRKPQIAQRLGLNCKIGMRAVLEERASVEDAIVSVSINGQCLKVLPTERPSSRSSDWIRSAQMAATLERIKLDSERKIIILDLPPMLTGDDVLSILPEVDCVLLIAAAGMTTTKELKECAKYLSNTPIARVVLNKLDEPQSSYYYY